jgi:hypothetical protein
MTDDIETLTDTSWRMWAVRKDRGLEAPGHRRYAAAHAQPGEPVIPVVVTEDTDGDFYGWVPTGETVPRMIYGHRIPFNMCFPYGVQAEVNAGHGRVARLTVVADSHSILHLRFTPPAGTFSQNP